MTSKMLVAIALLPLLSACGATPEPVTPATAAPEPPPPAAPVCATKEACEDEGEAAGQFERGCKGGDREACEHQEAVVAMADPLAVPGANLRVASITADGFTLHDMACKVAGGGLEMMLAGPVLAAVLGKKKAALAACAPRGADVAVRWTITGHRVVDARAKANDDKKTEACVERVVKSSAGTFDATCRATIHIGAH